MLGIPLLMEFSPCLWTYKVTLQYIYLFINVSILSNMFGIPLLTELSSSLWTNKVPLQYFYL